MADPTHEQIERLLWQVVDDAEAFIADSMQHHVPIERRLDRVVLLLAMLAKALAGGYRSGGMRE